MKCPCCNEKMKYKHKEGYYWPFSTGPEPDYPDYYEENIYKCKECHIKKINDKWEIPEKYKPTDKQVRTIHFINNVLSLDLEALTKKQCIKDIGKYLDKAKRKKEKMDYNYIEYAHEDIDDSFYDYEEYF